MTKKEIIEEIKSKANLLSYELDDLKDEIDKIQTDFNYDISELIEDIQKKDINDEEDIEMNYKMKNRSAFLKNKRDLNDKETFSVSLYKDEINKSEWTFFNLEEAEEKCKEWINENK